MGSLHRKIYKNDWYAHEKVLNIVIMKIQIKNTMRHSSTLMAILKLTEVNVSKNSEQSGFSTAAGNAE